jgi:mutator protein MutT
MAQKYSVFSNRSSLVFHNNDFEKFSIDYKHKYFEDIQSLKSLFNQWKNEPDDTHWAVMVDHPEQIVDFLYRHTAKPIEASGCIVKNAKGEVLMMKRLGFWDLPKGKIDKGETPDQAAIRELEEETGVEAKELNKLIDFTFHIYEMKGQLMFKKTWWFEAVVDFKGKLIPQTEEHIEKLLWVDVNELWLDAHRNETYSSIFYLLKRFKSKP